MILRDADDRSDVIVMRCPLIDPLPHLKEGGGRGCPRCSRN